VSIPHFLLPPIRFLAACQGAQDNTAMASFSTRHTMVAIQSFAGPRGEVVPTWFSGSAAFAGLSSRTSDLQIGSAQLAFFTRKSAKRGYLFSALMTRK
jgi:hypothetical protein